MKAHRLLYHPTLGLRVIKNKEASEQEWVSDLGLGGTGLVDVLVAHHDQVDDLEPDSVSVHEWLLLRVCLSDFRFRI